MKRNIISTALLLVLGFMSWTGIQMYWYPYDQSTAVLHTFTGILFLGFVLVHLWNNLKPLKGYLLKRKGQWKVQPLTTTFLSLLGILLLFVPIYKFDLPPITSVYELGKDRKLNQDIYIKRIQAAIEPEGLPVSIEVLRGAKATDPQMAIWAVDKKGQLIKTLFVSNGVAKEDFVNLEGNHRRPEALPVWTHLRGIQAADGLYVPDSATEVPDGISGATPNTNFALATNLEGMETDSLRIFLEINASFDWNEKYHEKAFPDDPVYSGPGMVGQPALIFSTSYFKVNTEQILKMKLVGRAHHSGKNGVIYSDMEGITTAKQLVERALVFVEPAANYKKM